MQQPLWRRKAAGHRQKVYDCNLPAAAQAKQKAIDCYLTYRRKGGENPERETAGSSSP